MANMIFQDGSETTLLWISEVNDSIHSLRCRMTKVH
jgi:hypothetical protein